MLVVYASLTGNVRRFVASLGEPAVEFTAQSAAAEPFIFVTYTIGFGEVPAGVDEWLQSNRANLRGIVVSGNRNWGANFGKAGDILAARYNVPLLRKIELAGTATDIRTIIERMRLIE
ncbi:class Ib ribonucleoside-diphosphate reductase assembly flavoprotein NrdI [uncultured Planococcus sp.]|uniref:class Ib ribonucleoside-diphosphate reductase assembly flavoprotein NrdI n=1 Tax=uncultured Planococcus sp. TaxID=337815 RepID=UPI00260DB8B9|nr:class Ib ribonucleoside-diphosphate reductase assembly flavoprotein NrdI [uncultured Planococcus sp.]